MPLASSANVVARFPMAMAEVLGAVGVDPRFVEAEMSAMGSVVLAKTASLQALGVMNEFAFMAEPTISTGRSDPTDLVGLSGGLRTQSLVRSRRKTATRRSVCCRESSGIEPCRSDVPQGPNFDCAQGANQPDAYCRS